MDGGEGLGGGDDPAIAGDFAFADQGGGDIRKGREIAAGADRSLGRDSRKDSAVDQIAHPLQQHGPNAGSALRQAGEPHDHDGDGFGFVEHPAGSAAVKPDEVRGQFAGKVGRHRRFARGAEAGVDAVDYLAFFDEPIEQFDASIQRLPEGGRVVQRDPGRAVGDGQNVVDADFGWADGDNRFGGGRAFP